MAGASSADDRRPTSEAAGGAGSASTGAGAPPPAGGPGVPPRDPRDRAPGAGPTAHHPPPGLRTQTGLTFQAGRRMAEAHIELAKAELAGISENLKVAAALAGVALAAAIWATLLITIGTSLFVGEWLFGSIGWGVVLGTEVCVLVITAAAGLIVKPEGMHFGRDIALALLGAVFLSAVFALGLTNQAWQYVTDLLNLGLDVAYRLLAVALAVSVIVFAILGAIVGAWRGGSRSIGSGLVLGVFIGLAFGAFTAIDPGLQVGVALGIMFGLIILIILIALDIARGGIDQDRLKARFVPAQTIATTKETIEWLQTQTPGGPAA